MPTIVLLIVKSDPKLLQTRQMHDEILHGFWICDCRRWTSVRSEKQERDFIPKAQEEVAFSIYEQFMDGKLDRENWYWQRRSGKSIDALSLKPKEDIFTQNIEFWFVKDQTIFLGGGRVYLSDKVLSMPFSEVEEIGKNVKKLQDKIWDLHKKNIDQRL